jgi:Tfp pilus assembly protein PilF
VTALPERTQRAIGLALLVVLTVVAYFGVQDLGFVYDDRSYVVLNPRVMGGLTGENTTWGFTTGYISNWHPLTWMSLMLDAELLGSAPRGFHQTNLVLHVANVLLLALVLARMTGAWWRPVLVAALFAVHPQHVESVAWVAERKDVLSTLFGLLAIGAYVCFVQHEQPGRRRLWYVLSLLTFAASLASKQMLVTLPFLLLVVDVWPLSRAEVPWRRKLLEKLPFLALSMSASLVILHVQSTGGATTMLDPVSFPARLANAVLAYGMYLGRTVWPTNLAAFYPHPGAGVSFPAAFAVGAVLAAITAGVLAVRKARPYLATGWLWYLGTLVPVIGVVQIGMQQRADRYTYVPLIGIYVAAVWLLAELVPKRGRGVAVAAATTVLIALTLVARQQVVVWKDTITLFTHALRVTEHNALAHTNLASGLLDQGRHEEAERHLRTALELEPRLIEAQYNLGYALAARGEVVEAEERYRNALQLDPNHVRSHANLGLLLVQEERHAEGIHQLRAAARLAPDDPLTLTTLANALAGVGKLGEAFAFYESALALDPSSPTIHFNYGNALLRGNRPAEARARFEEAVRLEPRFGLASDALRRLQGGS